MARPHVSPHGIVAALRQLAHLESDPLDRIMAAQSGALMEAETAFALYMQSEGSGVEGVDEMDFRTLAALAVTRLIERTPPEDFLALVTPFDSLLR